MSGQLVHFFAIVYSIAMLAAAGQETNYELFEFASSISVDDIYADGCTIMDLNSDGMPEVYLTASSGWQYHVFYYLNGEVHDVEDMTPWAWSNRLLYTSDGKLVMYTFPHTYGSDGILNYRVWQWGEEGYSLVEDLWRIPKEWDWNGEGDMNDPNNFVLTAADYISSDIAIDPFPLDEFSYADLLITQAEFERRTEGFNEAEVILNPYGNPQYQWDFDWWKEYDEDTYDEAYAIIRLEIAWEILNWEQIYASCYN